MFNNLHPRLSISDLFSRIGAEKRQATELALEAESRVRHLNGLTPDVTEADLVSVLQSTCLLLERLENLTLSEPSAGLNQQTKPDREKTSESSELSSVIGEIIKLRDWVLLAKKSNPEADTEILTAIDRQLRQILEREDIICIEETGMFNCERQKIVATQTTNNPQQGDRICDTVRPGYLIGDRLIRPQEVIIHVLQPSKD